MTSSTGNGGNDWVIGRGLLGGALVAAIGDRVWRTDIEWGDPARTSTDLRTGLSRFLEQAHGPSWRVFWSAGKGVTSSPQSVFDAELAVFGGFIDDLAALPAEVRGRGCLYLASSVGGVYAGAGRPPFTEETPTCAASAYGTTKLRMEQLVRELSADAGPRSLIARITNLYGTGQDPGKRQGLLSVVIGSYVTGRPTSIYVTADTLRDYISTQDCADVSLAAMDRLAATEPGSSVTKIISGLQPLSVGAILGAVARQRRTPAPIVFGQGDATGQAQDLRVRSVVWPDLDALVRTPLAVGIDQIYRAQIAALAGSTDQVVR